MTGPIRKDPDGRECKPDIPLWSDVERYERRMLVEETRGGSETVRRNEGGSETVRRNEGGLETVGRNWGSVETVRGNETNLK